MNNNIKIDLDAKSSENMLFITTAPLRDWVFRDRGGPPDRTVVPKGTILRVAPVASRSTESYRLIDDKSQRAYAWGLSYYDGENSMHIRHMVPFGYEENDI